LGNKKQPAVPHVNRLLLRYEFVRSFPAYLSAATRRIDYLDFGILSRHSFPQVIFFVAATRAADPTFF
jgi:hypothetical protein